MSDFNRVANVVVTGENDEQNFQLQVSKLRIAFDVKKSETPDTNNALIEIYNLSKSTRNLLDKVDGIVTLYAGYKESSSVSIVFKGNISKISTKFAQPDVITTIEADDGGKNLQDKKISLSYRSNASVKQILGDVVKQFGFDEQIEFSRIDFTDVILNTGFNFIGMTKTVMDKLTEMVGLNWSIQNNELKLYKGESTDNTIVINLSPATGMMGSPEQIKIKNNKDTESTKQLDGWKVISILQPKAEPGGKIKLTSKSMPEESEFKMLNVSHSGDTHGKRWFTKIQAVEL